MSEILERVVDQCLSLFVESVRAEQDCVADLQGKRMIPGGTNAVGERRAGLDLSEEGVTATQHERRKMARGGVREQTVRRPVPGVEHRRHLIGALEGFAGKSQCVPGVVSFQNVGVDVGFEASHVCNCGQSVPGDVTDCDCDLGVIDGCPLVPVAANVG